MISFIFYRRPPPPKSVTMATRNALSAIFKFQKFTDTNLGKVTKFQFNCFSRLGAALKNLRCRSPPPPPSPIRVKDLHKGRLEPKLISDHIDLSWDIYFEFSLGWHWWKPLYTPLGSEATTGSKRTCFLKLLNLSLLFRFAWFCWVKMVKFTRFLTYRCRN